VRKRKWIILLLILFGALSLILFRLFGPAPGKGPAYNGRHLSAWVDFIGEWSLWGLVDLDDALASEVAIKEIGTNAFPYLLQWIQSEAIPPSYKLPTPIYRFVAKRARIEKALMPRSHLRAVGSMEALIFLQTNIDAATVEELARLMNQTTAPKTASRAMVVLMRSGPEGIIPVVSLLDDTNSPMRSWAVRILATEHVGDGREILVPPLIRYINDPTATGRDNAVYALGKLGVAPELVLPVLISSFKSPDPNVRRLAAATIRNLGNHGLSALPALTNLFDDPDIGVRMTASNSVNAVASLQVTNAPAQ
jgi:hypothetical protein